MRAQRGDVVGDAAVKGEQQREDEFGDGDGVLAGAVGDVDAARTGGFDVDGVHADGANDPAGREIHRDDPGAARRRRRLEREIVGEFGGGIGRQALRIEHGLGKPRPDIDFPLRSCALQAIETEPGHDGDKKGLRIVNVLRPGKAEIGVLHHVFRVAAASEHAIGEPEQAPAMGRQRVAVMRPV